MQGPGQAGLAAGGPTAGLGESGWVGSAIGYLVTTLSLYMTAHTRETIRMNAAQLLDEYPTAGAGCEETFSMRKVSIAMHCCPFSNDTLNGG